LIEIQVEAERILAKHSCRGCWGINPGKLDNRGKAASPAAARAGRTRRRA
jgi:hypothetical protein